MRLVSDCHLVASLNHNVPSFHFQLKYAGRDVHPTPATGVGEVHQAETKQILEAALTS